MALINHPKNKKASVILSLVIFTSCSSPEEHLQKGKNFFANGELEKAVLELKSSTQDSKLGEPYYYMALIDEKNKNFKSMRDNLQKSLELDAGLVDARTKLAQLEIANGNLDEAVKQLDAVLLGHPDNLIAQVLQASVYYRQDKFSEADYIIEGVLKAHPDNMDAQITRIDGLVRRENITDALAVIKAALSKSPDSITLYQFKSSIDRQRRDNDAVALDYKELIRIDPANDVYKLRLAVLYNQYGKLPEAQALLQDIANASSEKVDNNLLLLNFLHKNASQKVAETYHAWVAESNLPVSKFLELSKWMIFNENTDTAVAELDKFIVTQKDSDAGLKAQVLLAEIPLRAKRFEEVDAAINNILQKRPDLIDAVLIKARSLLLQDKADETIALLNAHLSSKDKDKQDEVHAIMGLAWMQKKDMSKSEHEFRDALAINPVNIIAFFPVYNTLIQTKQQQVALRMLANALSIKPYEELLLFTKAEIDLQAKNIEEAAYTVNLLAMIGHNKLRIAYMQSSILLAFQYYDQAIDYCKQLLEVAPYYNQCMANIAYGYEALHARDKAISFLENHHAKHPNILATVSVLSDLYGSNKDFTKLEKLLGDQLKISPHEVNLYLDLSIVSNVIHKKPELVKDILEQGLASIPDDYKLSLALATWYQQQDDNNSARRIYEGILAKHPDAEVAINNLAGLLLESSDAADVKRGQVLIEKYKDSTNPDIIDTYAWSLIKKGETENGIKLLEVLVARAQEFAPARYHLALVDVQTDNKPLAINELKKAIEIADKQHRQFDGYKKAQKLLQELEAEAKK
jgi:predicted Zn-dependent protease